MKVLFVVLMFTWAFLLASAALLVLNGGGIGPIVLVIVACVGMGLTLTMRIKGRL